MIDRKDLIIVALVGFILAVTLYPRITTSNTWEPINPYDPWIDWDDNGEIDIFDKVAVGTRFGSTGDPTKNVTVTNFPLDEEGNLKVSFKKTTKVIGVVKDLNLSWVTGTKTIYVSNTISVDDFSEVYVFASVSYSTIGPWQFGYNLIGSSR